MILNRFVRSVSFDNTLIFLVSTGCAAVVYQAAYDGHDPLRRQLWASDCGGTGEERIILTPSICGQLTKEGFVVIDGFLSPTECLAARRDAYGLTYQHSPNERDGDVVRTDRVYFFERDDQTETRNEGLNFIQNQLHRVGFDICQSNFNGFDNDRYIASKLGIPSMMQVSMYDTVPGLTGSKDETVGAFYSSHLDCCSDSFLSLGLLGWLRSLYLRRRFLTCIVYLNPDWEARHGGCLRIYKKDGSGHVNVEPLAGRLVIFSSAHMWHSVLPTYSPRIACSIWLTIN